MPGRISMDQQGGPDLHTLKRKRGENDDGEAERPANHAPAALGPHDASHANGPRKDCLNGVQPNGVPSQDPVVRITNGEYGNSGTVVAALETPPQLDQSWRESAGNKSLGMLMDRLAQTCYADLNATITQMSERTVQQNAPQVNGVIHGVQQDNSEASLAKKRLLLTFADDQRDRFTKTLVLSDWARREGEIANLIDIKVWQEQQKYYSVLAAKGIRDVKVGMIPFKVPAPNIEGAMNLFATGKASGFPDLGYIPPTRLTARQLLRTLKDMNVTLATRLNLHDELPPYMQDFTVADGRATFRVPTEFEVDLSVADEDSASPFYFIDIRLSFQPTSGLLDDQFRNFLEGSVNEVLATKKLQGCYDFLHNFALTHKINILRNQASELIRGKWFDCVKVQHMRRSLIVQYWSAVPGPKNWFEIGISSGKPKHGKSRRRTAPSLHVRWFRKGIEINEELPKFDWQNLDLEACIVQIVTEHCRGKLAQVADGLRALASQSNELKVDFEGFNGAAEDMYLSLGMPSLRAPLEVRIEAVTGRFSLTPATQATAECERYLNTDPNADASRAVAQLLCALAQERIGKQAELLGWKPLQDVIGVRAHFGEGVLQRTLFSCSAGWGQKWAVGVSFGLMGMRWWIVRLAPGKPNERSTIIPREVVTAREFSDINDVRKTAIVSRAGLLEMEKLAVAEVSFSVLSQQLRDLHIPHNAEKHALTEDDIRGVSWRKPVTPAMILRFSQLLSSNTRDRMTKPWAAEYLRLTHHGIESANMDPEPVPASVRHDMRLTLEPGKMKHLQHRLTRAQDQDVVMNDTGGLAVRLRSPFGEPFVDQIKQRLASVERLDGYVEILRKLHFTTTVVTLARLEFTYSTEPLLNAHVSFASDGGLPVKLKLDPADSNPHQKIRVMLEQGLNKDHRESFATFAHLLLLTQPLLQTFERLQAAKAAKPTIAIRARSAAWYSMAYKAPLPQCVFQIRARSKVSGGKTLVRWHLDDGRTRANTEGHADDFVHALKELWQSKGDGWFGIGRGAIATSQGISAVVEQLDSVVQRFSTTEAPVNPVDSVASTKTETPAESQPAKGMHAKTSNNPPTATVAQSQQPTDVITID